MRCVLVQITTAYSESDSESTSACCSIIEPKEHVCGMGGECPTLAFFDFGVTLALLDLLFVPG